MDNRTRLLILAISAALALLVGCTATEPEIRPAEPVETVDANRADAMSAAEVVLSEMHFPLTKNDPNTGVMRAGPLSGAQFFEFWRMDNAGLGSALEANLHTIRRSVELNFAQVNGKLNVQCFVQVQRLSLPEKEIPSVTQAYRIYSRSTRQTQRLELYPDQMKNLNWIDLGQDPALAQQILTQITLQLAKTQKDNTT